MRLEEYRQKYRNIIHGTTKQRAGTPTWNKEIKYTYFANEKVDSDIAGETATLQALLTYPDDVRWYFCKSSGKYKQDVKEVHTFELCFDEFDSSETYFKGYVDRRNLIGTYVKTVDITMRTRNSEEGVVEVFTYTDVLSGVFKSYDFDYESEQYTGTNQTVVGKNICFIDEKFVSTTDTDADPNEHYDEPNYSLFFTYNFCQVYLFADRNDINKYAGDDRFNNKPTEDWTCIWMHAPEGSAIKDGVRAITGKRLSADAAQLNIDDVRDVYCFDGDCTLYLKFEPNSNISKVRCSNLTKRKTGNPDETEPAVEGLSEKEMYLVFRFADQSKTVNSIDDIDFDNLQDYIISMRINKQLTSDCVEVDFIPGFIFDGKYL